MMYNKIDKSILDKIVTFNNVDNKIDVIIKYNINFFEDIKKFKINDYINLPFISSIACRVDYNDVYKIASIESVNFISSNAKVSSLMYDAKKIIEYEYINNLHSDIEKHSCVIIDTGIYPHIDFCLGRNRIVQFVDLINNKKTPYDDNGHGTFIAGVFAGFGVTDKYSGIDNNSKIIVIKALNVDGETTTAKILESMQWVLNNKEKYNIKIVCMSFGSSVSSSEDPLIRGAEVLWDNGIVVVVAGGNNGPNAETIMSPGASRKVITVGALNSKNIDNLFVADFSSRGPAFDYYKPDIVVPGVDIISTNLFHKGRMFYTTMSGTSVATPMVAGVISLMLNYNQNYTPDQIKYMLINSTIEINRDRNSEGYGRLVLSKLKLI